MLKIQKRSGMIVDFDLSKIRQAIKKAMESVNQFDLPLLEKIVSGVQDHLQQEFSQSIPAVEQIQDIVEKKLMEYQLPEVAKSYILYRQKRQEQREQKNVMIDVEKTISEYINQNDWRVNANANQGYSLGGMILNTSGKVVANYWLSHIYPKEIGDAHRQADIHIHDLDMFSGYCAGWSLRQLLEEGFNGVENKVESFPPKHLGSAVAQMINFLGTLQNEWAGAQAFSSFDTYLSPFVKKYELELRDELKKVGSSLQGTALDEYLSKKVYKYTYDHLQSLVFNLNVPSRWGTQTPFTNITLDWICPKDLQDKRLLMAGSPFPYTFGELQPQMDIINEAFIDVMTKGDAKGRTFTFPIPTYNITKDFDWMDPKTDKLFSMTAKYGTPYFQNFINSDLNPGDVRSMCCRLQLDLRELKKRGGGLFGSSEMTGSIGVVTINAARLGYTCKQDKTKLVSRLQYLMQMAKQSLELKRKVITQCLDLNLYPYTKRYLGSLHNHFSTIGINGINECIRNFTNDTENITTPYGQAFAKEILDLMREQLAVFQAETRHLYNLEATPAEGTTYRFAKEDQKRYPGIIQAGTTQAPYYTNSSQIPVGYTTDVFEALTLQDSLQTKYTGGTVFHCYMNEKISSPQVCKKIVEKVLSRFHLPYITITPTFSICPKHGYLTGEYDFCPHCDQEIGYTGDRFDVGVRQNHVSLQAHK